MSIRKVRCSSCEIEYELTRKNVKNINMRVVREGVVKVSAPHSVSTERIDDFVRRNENFIINALQMWQRRESCRIYPENYVSGDTFMLLGKVLYIEVFQSERLPLELEKCPAAKSQEFVAREGETVYIVVNDTDDLHRKEYLFRKWLRSQQEDIFERTCRAVYPPFERAGIPYPQISIRLMKAKWGICRPRSGRITFNSRLAMAPPACIKYVAVHEFVHFIHPDHSKAFYEVLSAVLPDWKERKQYLNEHF